MKKILSLLVLTLVVATGCKSQSSSAQTKKLAQSNVEYLYNAYTRGTVMEIIISQKDIYAHKGRPVSGKSDVVVPYIEPKEENWEFLLKETAGINLDKLETLEVPSKKHQFDGALAATLTIKVDGKEYKTQTFDHGNPPAEIKPLVEKIIEISGLEKK